MESTPVFSPIAEQHYPRLAFSFCFAGFILFSWLIVYMGRTSTSSRSLFKELSVSGLTSVFLGLGAFFIFLSAGIYL